MSTKKATFWVLFWILLAAIFNIFIYFFMGKEKALEFLGGYLIEKSLSLDNLFLFILIFSTFCISGDIQRRVLNYGIIGAVVLRLIFIVLGVSVINHFHWVLYIFGAILIYSGIKMMSEKEEEVNVKECKTLRVLSKFIPVSSELDGNKFFTKKDGMLYATPLFAILVLVEVSDIIFAIDSIPAVFAITTDTFIVYTSNLFAILGLRSLYFLVEKLNETFEFVKYGVALILTFTGIKLSILFFHIEIPIIMSISIIGGILLLSILFSMIFKKEALNEA